MPYSFDGLDLTASPYKVLDGPQFRAAGRLSSRASYVVRPGGRLAHVTDDMRQVTMRGIVTGTSAANLEANVNALKDVLYRPNKRLVASEQDSRYWVANLTAFDAEPRAQKLAGWTATFEAEHPYQQAPTPSTDVRTPTLALLPGETTQYALAYSLTPGGKGAPAPLRVLLVNPSAGNTPTLVQAGVTSLVPAQAVTVSTDAFVGGSTLLFDPDAEGAVVFNLLKNVVDGYWPLEDGSGPAEDFSGNGRVLTANGGITYRADGYWGACCDFNGTTGFFDSAAAVFGYTGSLTFGAWVNGDVAGTDMGIMSKASSGNNGYHLSKRAAGGFFVQIGNGTTTNSLNSTTSSVTMTADRWYFVAASFNNTTKDFRLYVDGVLVAATVLASFSPTAGANNLRVGGSHTTAGVAEFWDGRVDEAFVSPGELSAANIRLLYHQSLPGTGTRIGWSGQFPHLDPRLGATNLFRVRADHPSAAPTPSVAVSWRSRYS